MGRPEISAVHGWNSPKPADSERRRRRDKYGRDEIQDSSDMRLLTHVEVIFRCVRVEAAVHGGDSSESANSRT